MNINDFIELEMGLIFCGKLNMYGCQQRFIESALLKPVVNVLVQTKQGIDSLHFQSTTFLYYVFPLDFKSCQC